MKCKICGEDNARAFYQGVRVCKHCFGKIKGKNYPKKMLEDVGIRVTYKINPIFNWLK